ncbi:Unknown protein [Striga hermonthica]|uniref:Transmembrane protein n=1 Tax=Striga hermonthica TaxID=68872 RepID=A0A9N7N120_STRHE|nr:Unknown protein [Striga hermonthica]
MVAPGNVNPTKIQAPPLPGQGRQPVRAAGVGMAASSASTEGSGYQGNPRVSSATQHGPEVLHQRSRLPMCPARMALAGFAAAAVIGYFTLYSNKKTEATALDVARVSMSRFHQTIQEPYLNLSSCCFICGVNIDQVFSRPLTSLLLISLPVQ